uniref:BTB domain-containing protein n=1 Tax=Strigamia maritima TaxID=126957 RepID=T1IWK3_STRMM
MEADKRSSSIGRLIRSLERRRNLYDLLIDGQLENVTLNCKNGHVHEHKSILTAGSDYFAAMFNHNTIENETNVVSLPDISLNVMNIIIKFLRGKNIPTEDEITESLIRETLVAADKLQLKDLFDEYWIIYSTTITVDNFIYIWKLAEMFNDDETAEKVRKFIVKNTKNISNSDILANMTETQLECIITGDLCDGSIP